MNKPYARFISALFCGALALSVAANALTPDKAASELENRTLAQKPELSVDALLSGEYMSDFETYTTDQFPGRDVWVAGKAWAERLTGKQENNGVYFCDGSTLITRFDAPGQQFEKNLGYVDQFAQIAGVPVSMALIPTQAAIWADKLPAGAPNYDQELLVDRTLNGTVPSADLWSALMAHKDEAIFYRTDHHWTSLGAYYGYAALGERLGYEPVPLSAYTKTTVSTEFYGTVFSNSGVRWVEPDQIDTYVPEDESITVTSLAYNNRWELVSQEPRQLYDESFLAKKDKYSMFLGGNQALGVVKTGHTDKPKLLIVRDSYTDSLVPFLTAHFSEIHLVDPRYFRLSVAQYIKNNGIDQALVLYSVPNFTSEKDKSLVVLTRE